MLIDRILYTFARRWLLFANLLVGLYVGLPLLAPVLMQAGLTTPARGIYTIYSPFCHQMASRSFFLFGDQIAYPRELAGSSLTPIEAYMPSVPEFAGASVDPAQWETFLLPAREFVGNEQMGYKMALCERDMGIYMAVFVTGLLFAVFRRRFNIRPMPFWLFLLVGLLPIALDGFSQLFSQFFVGLNLEFLAQLIPLRESTPFLRTITGVLFGFSLVWLIYPRLDEQMGQIADDQARKLAEAAAADSSTPI